MIDETEARRRSVAVATGLHSAVLPVDTVLMLLTQLPTIDPESLRPQGEWIDIYGGKYANPRYACSKCGGKALCKIEADVLGHEKAVQALTAYCPNCGVKMDLEA